MDYETKMKEHEIIGERRGKERVAISCIKILIKAIRDFGGTEEEVYQYLVDDYGKEFSPEKLKELMKETK